MLTEILDYIGLDLEKTNKNLECKKSEFNISKSYDNAILYRKYKMISIKDIDILIGMSDRTTDIKERFTLAKPINNFIKEDRAYFENLLKLAKIDDIKNVEKMQQEFSKHIPYFIKYEKNYLWQIYYSSENKKYFMLFPAREEGESSALFYLIKKKLENSDEKIYVPICKEETSESLLIKQEQTDIENYIWLFTKEWPNIYETEIDNTKKIYIIGKARIDDSFESKYRIEIKSKEEAENEYTLLKALFILSTQTHYKFNQVVDEQGRLRLEYDNEIIQIENLSEFISKQVIYQRGRAENVEKQIKKDKDLLASLKQDIKELNDIYMSQEKQIVMFLNCKKSIFKRIKFYLKKPSKIATFKEKKKVEEKIEEVVKEEISSSEAYTLSDLINVCKENSKIEEEYKNLKADIFAIKNKKINLEKKVKNAKKYLDEIENHKKSLMEFWKFAKKDENLAIEQAEENYVQNEIDIKLNLDEDFQQFAEKADILQRQKLSTDEINSLFVCNYVLNSINAVLLGKDEKALNDDLKKLKKEYTENKKVQIFGDIEEDYTKIKNLNNKKHRENKKNIYSVLKINDKTSLEDYKNIIENLVRLLNEAYKKITAIVSFPVYYAINNENEYVLAQIDPKKLELNSIKEKTIYKKEIKRDDNVLYFSNIVYYDNYNKTLPAGMDESTNVLIKTNENKVEKEKQINILQEEDLFNIKIAKIKILEV